MDLKKEIEKEIQNIINLINCTDNEREIKIHRKKLDKLLKKYLKKI